MHDDERQDRILTDAAVFAAAELAPQAAAADRAGALPRAAIDGLASRGLLAASWPAEHGGLGLDPVRYGRLTEEIGGACCAARTLLTVHTSLVGETLIRWGTAAQHARVLPDLAAGRSLAAFALTEPGVGSDARGVETAYVETDGGFVLTGTKKWISFGGLADLFVVLAARGEEVTAFLVPRDTPGLSTHPLDDLLAGRATHLAEVELHEVPVPRDSVLGRVGAGFSFVASTALDHGRYSVAWGSVGLAQAALDAMVSYVRQRRQFGQPLHEFQLVRGLLADATAGVHAARALCLEAGRLRARRDPEAVSRTIAAKYFAAKVANQVAGDAVQLHGALGISAEYPVARLYREAKVLEIIEGTSQILQDVLGRQALRGVPATPRPGGPS